MRNFWIKVKKCLLQIDSAHNFWNFSPDIFFKIQDKEVNKVALLGREQAKIADVKKYSKLPRKNFSTELGQLVVSLARL